MDAIEEAKQNIKAALDDAFKTIIGEFPPTQEQLEYLAEIFPDVVDFYLVFHDDTLRFSVQMGCIVDYKKLSDDQIAIMSYLEKINLPRFDFSEAILDENSAIYFAAEDFDGGVAEMKKKIALALRQMADQLD